MRQSLWLGCFLLACLWGGPLAAQPAIEVCDSPDLSFNSYESAYVGLEVTDSIEVQEVAVYTNISTTFVGYAQLDVSSPAGTTVRLHDYYSTPPYYSGYNRSDFDVTWSDSGVAYPPTNTTYSPAGTPSEFVIGGGKMQPWPGSGNAMSNIIGDSSDGTWELSMYSYAGPNTINNWCVRIWDVPAVSGLTCASGATEGDVDLSWTNLASAAYDGIDIVYHGEVVDTLTGDATSYAASGIPVGQLVTFSVRPFSSTLSAEPRTCSVALLPELTASVTVDPDPNYSITSTTGDYVGLFEWDADYTIGDIMVAADVSYGFMPYMQIYISSSSGTTVGLYDPTGVSGSYDSSITSINAVFWHYGAALTAANSATATPSMVKPTGPGALSDFFGESTINDDGEAGWAFVAVGMYNYAYSGSVNDYSVSIFSAVPTFPVSGLTCGEGGDLGEGTATWTNGDTYDGIAAYVNGEYQGLLAGSTTSISFSADSLPASFFVEVEGVKEGVWSSVSSCRVSLVLDPPSGLSCADDGAGGVILTWSNGAAYDTIVVTVDGSDEYAISGDATTWASADESLVFDLPSKHSFEVRGEVSTTVTGVSAELFCEKLLLDSLEINACDDPSGFGTYDSSVTVDEFGTAELIEVFANVREYYSYYIELSLEAPSGTTIGLKNYGVGEFVGSGFTDWLAIYADDGETQSSTFDFNCGCKIAPATSFTSLAGEGIDGDWTLHMGANFGGGEEGINEWCLRMDYCPVLPPSDLLCEASGSDSVDISWFVGDTYSSIDVLQDDAVIASLGGTVESYSVSGLEPGRYNFRVVGNNTMEGCSAPSPSCRTAVGFTEVCTSDSSFFTDLVASVEYPDSIIVGDVDVTLDMTTDFSTYYWQISLTSPFGTNVGIHTRYSGGTGYSNFSVIYNDGGDENAPPWDCGYCLMQPTGSFSDFEGEISDGSWDLNLDGDFYTATLNNYCVAIREGCTLSPPSDVVCEPIGVTHDIDVSWANNDTYDSIIVNRNGADVATLSGSADSYVDEGVLSGFFTYRIYGVDEDGGTEVCRSGSRLCDTEVGVVVTCNETDVVLDSFSEQSEVEITDDIAIDEVRVFVDATISFSYYLAPMSVVSPAGTQVELMNYAFDASGYTDVNCTFADDGEVQVDYSSPTDFACDGCLVAPVQDLADLADESSVGTWTLDISLLSYTGGWSLNEWCLQIFIGCPIGRPEILSCTASTDNVGEVLVEWKNADEYDGITVYRNGAPVATVDGAETSYVDTVTEGGTHTYNVLAENVSLDCSRSSRDCTTQVGLLEVCNNDVGLSFDETGNFDFLDWQSTAIEDALDEDPDFDPTIAEAQAFVDISATGGYGAYLSFAIYSPDFTKVDLYYYDPSVGSSFSGTEISVIFSDSGVGALSNGNATCGDCLVVPKGPGMFSDLVGEDPRGTWIMTAVSWYASYYGGEVNDWCVGVFTNELPGGEPPPPPSGPQFKRGDCNNNGAFSALSDATFMLNWAFSGGPVPGCLTACDSDNNNAASALADALHMLNFAFSGGPAPPSPGTLTCGQDPETPLTGGAPGCVTESATCNTP